MPPRKRLRTKEPYDAEVGVNISERAAELGDGETGNNNLGYLSLVAEAWETIEGHQALSQQNMSGMFWPTCNWSRPPCPQPHRGRGGRCWAGGSEAWPADAAMRREHAQANERQALPLALNPSSLRTHSAIELQVQNVLFHMCHLLYMS